MAFGAHQRPDRVGHQAGAAADVQALLAGAWLGELDQAFGHQPVQPTGPVLVFGRDRVEEVHDHIQGPRITEPTRSRGVQGSG